MNRAFRFILVGFLLASRGLADDEAPTESDREKLFNQQLKKLNQQYAEDYVITTGNSDSPLKLGPESVFNWLNAARVNNPRIQKGAVYIWTQKGRAEVVGTIFSVSHEMGPATFYHEFHSLATGPLRATVTGRLEWDTTTPGVKFVDFPNAAPPADTAVRRMAEMRAFARKFSGHSINYDEKKWELNLLPQPLYRMADPIDGVLDQGVFAMISTAGTDPEVLLVIEARKVDEKFRWQYAVCRFTDLTTHVSLGEQEVWSFPNGTKGPNVDAGTTMPYRFINAGSVNILK